MSDAFETATYYDCRESDELTHESPEEAIEEFIDLFCDPAADVTAVIAKHSPITVVAHRREEVSPSWIDNQAVNLYEHLEDGFAEEYGDPDGDDDGLGDPAIRLTALTTLRRWIAETVSNATVWRCEKVAERTYSVEEVLTLMVEHRPEWFEQGEKA